MKALLKILAGGVGLAALASAAPAAAQYYPGYPGYGYGNQNVIGQVLGQILNPYGNRGYGGYGNERVLIDRCAGAVQHRINTRYSGGYAPYGAPYGYGGYGNYGYGNARILGITRVDRRSSGLRIRGVATAGNSAGYGYNPYGGYNQGGELSFKCNIDYRGRITDIDLDRNRYAYGYRGY
jgi:hypothetical protein